MILFIGVIFTVLSASYAQEFTICDGVPLNTFISDVSRCNGWFRCTSTGPVPGTCPSPWLFNPTTQECDWDFNVQCFTCPPTDPIINLPVNDTSCRQFFRCINGQPSHQVCQSGLLFNPVTRQCDVAANVPCETQFTCPINIPPGTMFSFRDNANCSVFFVCTGTPNPTRQECNQVLHFDPVTQQCTFPELTDCPIAGQPTTQNPGDPPATTVPPGFSCTGDGHFPHPTSCQSFIVCAAGVPTTFNCSAGLHFNSATNQCDLPQNANCTI